jgi:hypothetical protein
MTQVYQVAHKTLLDNYAVLETLTPNEVYVGASIVVAGVDATFNGTYTVLDVPEYLFIGVDEYGDLLFNYEVAVPFQILYAKTASYVTRTTATGTVTLARHRHRVDTRYNFSYSMRCSCKRLLFSKTFRKRLHRPKRYKP